MWSFDSSEVTFDSVLYTLDGSGGGSGPVILTPESKYPFESIGAFFTDFAEIALFEDYEAEVILSQPGESILGGAIASNQYEIEYVTNTLPGLVYGSVIEIAGVTYTVLHAYYLDDGVTSRARLQT